MTPRSDPAFARAYKSVKTITPSTFYDNACNVLESVFLFAFISFSNELWQGSIVAGMTNYGSFTSILYSYVFSYGEVLLFEMSVRKYMDKS